MIVVFKLKNYNDIEINDLIEAFQEVEVKKKLKNKFK
jgi:translation initiation factor IF-2